MCPAIHITSRSWLRSSSTHEPSDPPLRVVVSLFSYVRLRKHYSCLSAPSFQEREGTPLREERRRTSGRAGGRSATGTRREDRCAPIVRPAGPGRVGSIAPALLLKTSGSVARAPPVAGRRRRRAVLPSAQRRPWTAGHPLEVRRSRTGHSSALSIASSQRPQRQRRGAREDPAHLGPAVGLRSTPFHAKNRTGAAPLRQDVGTSTVARPPENRRGGPDSVFDPDTRSGSLVTTVRSPGDDGLVRPTGVPGRLPDQPPPSGFRPGRS